MTRAEIKLKIPQVEDTSDIVFFTICDLSPEFKKELKISFKFQCVNYI